MRRENDMARLAGLVGKALAEEFDSGLAESLHGLMHGGQRRVDKIAEQDVVDADDRDISRHGEAEVAGRRAGAESMHVVEGDDGARRRIPGEQLGGGGTAMLGGVGVVEAEGRRARAEQARVERNTRLGERILIAAMALLAREGRGRAGDVADPAVAKVDQMAGGEVAGIAIVDADAVDGEVDAFASPPGRRRRASGRDP